MSLLTLAAACVLLTAGMTPAWTADSPLAANLVGPAAYGLDEARFDPAAVEQTTQDALRKSAEALSQGRPVQIEVVDLRAWPDSVAALSLEGVGRIRIERGDWIPLRFHAGYDLVDRNLFGLRIQPIATAARSANGAIDAGMGERVNDQVAARILSEFPDQPLEIVFVDLQPTSDSNSHVAFRGTGLVDFANEGSAPVSFSAILDRSSGLVVALDYSFEIAGAHGEAAYTATIAALQ